MIYIDGTDNYPPLLDSLNDCPVLFPIEFGPSGEYHDRCHYDRVIFYDFADDLMSTDYFKENFEGFFAVYVVKVCSKCGDIEWLDSENYIPQLYLKLIRETSENCSRFHYHNDSDYDLLDYEWVEE